MPRNLIHSKPYEPVKAREPADRVATPIIGGLSYHIYHVYPMAVIFILVGFGPIFDSINFNILCPHERRKAGALGVANVTWFFYRWCLPCYPEKGLLIQASDWTTVRVLYRYRTYIQFGNFLHVLQTNNLTLLLLASSKLFFKEICNSHLFSHIIIDFTISNPFTF